MLFGLRTALAGEQCPTHTVLPLLIFFSSDAED